MIAVAVAIAGRGYIAKYRIVHDAAETAGIRCETSKNGLPHAGEFWRGGIVGMRLSREDLATFD